MRRHAEKDQRFKDIVESNRRRLQSLARSFTGTADRDDQIQLLSTVG